MTKKEIIESLGRNWEKKFTLGGVDQNGCFHNLYGEEYNIKDTREMLVFIEEWKDH